MNVSVRLLKEMQDLDNRRQEIQDRKSEIDVQNSARAGEAAKSEGELEVLRASLQSAQVQAKSREIDIGTQEDRRTKLKSQLLAVKTNKEYSAISDEIRNISADIGKMEEEGLVVLGRIDEIQSACRAKEAEVEKLRAAARSEEVRQEEEVGRIDAEAATLQLEWDRIAAGAGPELVATYRRIAVGRGGRAVAAAQGGVCMGCHMNLAPQIVNLLMSAKEIVTCQSCQRVLYLAEEKAEEKPDAENAAGLTGA